MPKSQCTAPSLSYRSKSGRLLERITRQPKLSSPVGLTTTALQARPRLTDAEQSGAWEQGEAGGSVRLTVTESDRNLPSDVVSRFVPRADPNAPVPSPVVWSYNR
jgi:hypothetical protein